jgi:hypothetical protein
MSCEVMVLCNVVEFKMIMKEMKNKKNMNVKKKT